MPARLLDAEAGDLQDRMDLDVHYPRASPEKALLDWIYLGGSPRTKLASPTLDIDLERLDKRRLKRLADQMKLSKPLAEYLAQKRRYDQDPSVRANAPVSEREPSAEREVEDRQTARAKKGNSN
jgi:hypothetical protein